MKNLRRMLACGLLLSQLFCGQAWAAEVHTPCYRNSVDTENSDFDKGEWKYRFTADSGQETVLTEGEKHTFLIINGGLSAEHIIIENGRAFMELGALCDALGLQREELIACGDGMNDISMIEYAGLGAAMENPYPPVKEKADIIAPSNDEDGVAEIIAKYF